MSKVPDKYPKQTYHNKPKKALPTLKKEAYPIIMEIRLYNGIPFFIAKSIYGVVLIISRYRIKARPTKTVKQLAFKSNLKLR